MSTAAVATGSKDEGDEGGGRTVVPAGGAAGEPTAASLPNATLQPQQQGSTESGGVGSTEAFLGNDAKTQPMAEEHSAPGNAATAAKRDPPKEHTLPQDLQIILKELATTGTSSWLNWCEDGTKSSQVVPHRRNNNSLRPFSSAKRGAHSHKRARTGRQRGGIGGRKQQQQLQQHRLYSNTTGGGSTTTTTTTTAASAASAPSSRMLTLNGLNSRGTLAAAAGGRKRPLVLIGGSNNKFSPGPPGSVGSGRTSGSEPEDLSQSYECDSEGTSATSNSEISFDQGRTAALKRRGLGLPSGDGKLGGAVSARSASAPKYSSLKEALRVALNLVLDHFYSHRGGYKLSPAEQRKKHTSMPSVETKVVPTSLFALAETDASKGKISEREAMMLGSSSGDVPPGNSGNVQARLFQQRKLGLVDMLMQTVGKDSAFQEPLKPSAKGLLTSSIGDIEPPFTVQRIAEVLVAPERYYTQTHKLCNCLEKLLLVSSPASAFGGFTGGETTQSRTEVTELAALADEMGRQKSEFRQSQRRLRRTMESPLSDDSANDSPKQRAHHGNLDKKASPDKGGASAAAGPGDGAAELQGDELSREAMEAAARASLRSKFDHVGIDPHSSGAVGKRDVRLLAEQRSLTNSPPPPVHTAAPGITLPGSGLLHHGHASPTSPQRTRSPILFGHAAPDGSSPPPLPMAPSLQQQHATTPAHLHFLHMHHTTSPAVATGASPFELMSLNSAAGGGALALGGSRDVDSSASSDVDSESDVSFDDSASDRSDSSDPGQQQHYEPLTAASRAMAMNRMQQHSRSRRTLPSPRADTVVRHPPPADSEYQSGDSIDSTRAEDSGESDSSDVAE